MKKYFISTITVLLVLTLLGLKFMKKHNDFPSSPPNISITHNQMEIETARGDYAWADKDKIGNSNLADDSIKLVKNLKTTFVKGDDEIKFTFDTSWKQPNETILVLETQNGKLSRNVLNKNSFNVPKEKGEYIFSICGSWDAGHNVVYVFKVNVTL